MTTRYKNHMTGLEMSLPFFRGRELITTQVLGAFEPIVTPAEVCLNNNIIDERIYIDPFTNLITVKGLFGIVDGKYYSTYTANYRYATPTQEMKNALFEVTGRDIEKFTVYNVASKQTEEIPYLTSISNEFIGDIIGFTITPINDSLFIYNLEGNTDDTKALYLKSRGSKAILDDTLLTGKTQVTMNLNRDRSMTPFNLKMRSLRTRHGGLCVMYYRYEYSFKVQTDSLPVLVDGLRKGRFYRPLDPTRTVKDINILLPEFNTLYKRIDIIKQPDQFPYTLKMGEDAWIWREDDFAVDNPALNTAVFNANVKPNIMYIAQDFFTEYELLSEDLSDASSRYVEREIDDIKLILVSGREVDANFALITRSYQDDPNKNQLMPIDVKDIRIKLKGEKEWRYYSDEINGSYSEELATVFADNYRYASRGAVFLGIKPADDDTIIGPGDFNSRPLIKLAIKAPKPDIFEAERTVSVYRSDNKSVFYITIKDSSNLFVLYGSESVRKNYYLTINKAHRNAVLANPELPDDEVGKVVTYSNSSRHEQGETLYPLFKQIAELKGINVPLQGTDADSKYYEFKWLLNNNDIQNEGTIPNADDLITKEDNVVLQIKIKDTRFLEMIDCFSLFMPARNLYYRQANGFEYVRYEYAYIEESQFIPFTDTTMNNPTIVD